MNEIMAEVKRTAVELVLPRLFAEVSLTARGFFERQDFVWIRDNIATVDGVELPNFIMEWRCPPVINESGTHHPVPGCVQG
ncbi:MAG: hypothetical protein EOP85_18505 [Verrucomicrobiaceae bacterium]|nr:MAG: hypothetical protein EOP85_18505 [Verrucomicrobiaceae bacterium]